MIMAKSASPFEFDFSQFNDFNKLLTQFKVPTLDTSAVVEAQRKNIEVLTNVEGYQAMARRQAEIINEAVEEAAKATKELSTVAAPQERFAKQAELSKKAYESAVANTRELVEMSAKSNSEVVELINGRVSESLEEMKALLAATGK
jgi:phasin family protein